MGSCLRSLTAKPRLDYVTISTTPGTVTLAASSPTHYYYYYYYVLLGQI